MALEEHDQDAGLQSFQDLSDLSSDRDFLRNPAEAKAPARQDLPHGREEVPDLRLRDAERAQKQSRGKGRFGFIRRHPIAIPVALVLLAVAAGAGYLYWDNAAHFETTDDAFIAARQFPIAPKVSGYLTAVPVTDNEHVDAGAVIARIDDRDYRTALAQAEAQVAAAQASIGNVDAQIAVQEAQIAQNEAQVQQAQAALVFAQEQSARYQELARTGAGSVQNAQQYTSQLTQQQAALKTAQASLVATTRQLSSLKAQRSSAEANVAQANAQRDQAKLNLSYTTVTTAQSGRVVNLTGAVGEYAQPGTNLTMFVPDDIWVDANFKETQLDKMRPNQPVTINIDAYPEREFRGHVDSVQPGSGTAFSLLPAENATGNYVKIVQRVPVKIIIDNAPTEVSLGPGMSVEPDVRIDPNPSLYERLRGWL
ncbi:MAG: HlyD family secretion protein [Acetobacteraceae bacterium]|nr:HlyD family secretion protein [Acetobacteraceae bacterium]